MSKHYAAPGKQYEKRTDATRAPLLKKIREELSEGQHPSSITEEQEFEPCRGKLPSGPIAKLAHNRVNVGTCTRFLTMAGIAVFTRARTVVALLCHMPSFPSQRFLPSLLLPAW